MPRRYRDMHRLGRWYNKGFTDLAYLAAMIGNQLRQYEYIWLVENDVDYAGTVTALFWHGRQQRRSIDDLRIPASAEPEIGIIGRGSKHQSAVSLRVSFIRIRLRAFPDDCYRCILRQ